MCDKLRNCIWMGLCARRSLEKYTRQTTNLEWYTFGNTTREDTEPWTRKTYCCPERLKRIGLVSCQIWEKLFPVSTNLVGYDVWDVGRTARGTRGEDEGNLRLFTSFASWGTWWLLERLLVVIDSSQGREEEQLEGWWKQKGDSKLVCEKCAALDLLKYWVSQG